MALTDDQLIGVLRELVMTSYTSARPRGMRGVRQDDLLALARKRLGEAITEGELQEAVDRIGGSEVRLTSTVQLIASLFGRRERWRTAFLIPGGVFDGLKPPTRFRTPRSTPVP